MHFYGSKITKSVCGGYYGILAHEIRDHSIKEFTLICSQVITYHLVIKGGVIFVFSFVILVLVLSAKQKYGPHKCILLKCI